MPEQPMSQTYLEVAASALTLLSDPAVAGAWRAPSALAGFTVGGLAEHLATQIFSVRAGLAAPWPDHEVIGLLDHYSRVSWLGADLDAEANVAIREGGEQSAAEGPQALVGRADAALAELRDLLPALPADRPLSINRYAWALRLEDVLVTRVMELAVHSDDLAVSVGVPTPSLPPQAVERVTDLLTRLAVQRHGPTAVLRALSRAERAPTSISAF
ncbi:Mycothiol maleylpyruvate isomerase N-terminal domain-containing protein [Thermomonospora echinospora]|uniref:Mycothiol maleylpyruvate isomerase N-terminal domain-containing protein n=1 Tax=Thermomonospora echinospora TaxID=1992 RepID=A0A1H5VLW8_9ACTN|nr:maleylpyruvate isomerase N-terminal domain-containing protein [Thermomonospora echinospora]SEF87537.1 Mycothiol maleylpyruvate isomerase N-terminal domain-containing protein [Thermomonospora echinospora]